MNLEAKCKIFALLGCILTGLGAMHPGLPGFFLGLAGGFCALKAIDWALGR